MTSDQQPGYTLFRPPLYRLTVMSFLIISPLFFTFETLSAQVSFRSQAINKGTHEGNSLDSENQQLIETGDDSLPLLEYYEQAIRANPAVKNLHLQLGLQLWSKRKIAAAESQFHEELRLDPQCDRARLMLGLAAVEEGRDADAVRQLDLALSGDSSLKQAYLALGRAWFRLGNLDKASEALESAARAEPGLAPIYPLLAQVYSRLGRRVDAERMLVLDTKSRNLRLAESSAALGYWAEALQLVSDFLGAFPSSSRGLYVKGLVLFNGYRKIGEATTVLEQAIVINPANIEARRLLGIMYWVAGNEQRFQQEMTMVLNSSPLDALAHYYWGRYIFEKGNIQEARWHLERARRFRPSDERIATNLALLYEALGLNTDAEREHRGAISLAEKQKASAPLIYQNYGAFLLNRDRASEALPILLKAVRFPRPHPKGYYLVGVALAQTGQPLEAIKYLEQAVTADPQSADPRRALAALYDQVGRKEDAVAQGTFVEKIRKSSQEHSVP